MAEFTDRYDAGRRLARHLTERWARGGEAAAVAPGPGGPGPDGLVPGEPVPGDRESGGPRGWLVVLGLPRGGVPVAEPVARALAAPLDVIMVRKLGVPVHPELSMGAIGEDGVGVLDESIMRHYGVNEDQLAEVRQREGQTLSRRANLYRRGRLAPDLRGTTAVLVDDGMATGATARVACRIARHLGAARVVLALPVAARDTVEALRRDGVADEVLVVSTPEPFRAVGAHYADFRAVQEEDVVEILGRNP